MAKKTARRSIPHALRQLPAGAIAELRRLASRRSTDLRWYYNVGVALEEAVPRGHRNAIEAIASGVFDNVKLQPTLYACRAFARAIPRRDLRRLNGLNWAIVHHVIYASDDKRDTVVEKIQKLRRSRAKRGETLTPAEARLIVQEACGKDSFRRPKLARIPTLGPKSALRETTRLCEEFERFCGAWLQVAARNSRRLSQGSEGQQLRTDAVNAIQRLQSFLRTQLAQLQTVHRRRPR